MLILLPLALLAVLIWIVPRSSHKWQRHAFWLVGGAAAVALAGLGPPGAAGLSDGLLTTADFDEYCAGTAVMRDGAAWVEGAGWPVKRSRLAGLGAGLAARWLGIVDGLLLLSVLGTFLMALATALWASMLGGRVAGAAALGVLLALGPTLLLPRQVSFYGALAASGALAAAAVGAAMVRPRSRWFWVAAVMVWVPVLVDLRGFFWTAPLAAGLAASTSRWRRLSLVPLFGLGWILGRVAYPHNALPLEVQVWQAANVVAFDGGARPPEAWMSRGLVWGRSALMDLPGSVWALLRMPRGEAGHRIALDPHVLPSAPMWTWLIVACGVGLLGAVRARGRVRVAMGVTCGPGLVLWGLALASDLAEPRLLVGAGPALAVVVACGLVSSRTSSNKVFSVLVLGLGMVLVPTGWGLAWNAPWRPQVHARQSHIERLMASVDSGRRESGRLRGRCVAALREDQAAGHPSGSRWLGEVTSGESGGAGRRR